MSLPELLGQVSSSIGWGDARYPVVMLFSQSYGPKQLTFLQPFRVLLWLSSASTPGFTVKLSRGK